MTIKNLHGKRLQNFGRFLVGTRHFYTGLSFFLYTFKYSGTEVKTCWIYCSVSLLYYISVWNLNKSWALFNDYNKNYILFQDWEISYLQTSYILDLWQYWVPKWNRFCYDNIPNFRILYVKKNIKSKLIKWHFTKDFQPSSYHNR